jgi:glutamyl-tRNA synthetase
LAAHAQQFSWAYARKHGGIFILRIEDTDVERSTHGSLRADQSIAGGSESDTR